MRTEKYGLKVDDKLVEFVEANACQVLISLQIIFGKV